MIFPDLFKEVLRARAKAFCAPLLLAAAKTLEESAQDEKLLPPILTEGFHEKVARAVERAALDHPQVPYVLAEAKKG